MLRPEFEASFLLLLLLHLIPLHVTYTSSIFISTAVPVVESLTHSLPNHEVNYIAHRYIVFQAMPPRQISQIYSYTSSSSWVEYRAKSGEQEYERALLSFILALYMHYIYSLLLACMHGLWMSFESRMSHFLHQLWHTHRVRELYSPSLCIYTMKYGEEPFKLGFRTSQL